MNRLASTATTGVLADSFKVKLPGRERQMVFFGRLMISG